MHWPLAIARNREALLAVVAGIVALLGGREGGAIARRLRNAALALLRPAESAARRLIVIAARGLVAPLRDSRPPMLPIGIRPGAAGAAAGAARPPAFRLFDRSKRFVLALPRVAPSGAPRIRSFWGPPLIPGPGPVEGSNDAAPAPRSKPDPDSPVDAARLHLRLAALERVLADLPRQARRLARWRARSAAGRRPCAPLRLGRPPGWRKRPGHDVDLVLRECHALARDALADTS